MNRYNVDDSGLEAMPRRGPANRYERPRPLGRPSRWSSTRGFILTNLTLPSRAVVRFYNKRGTAEQCIKEGKQAVKKERCRRNRSKEKLFRTLAFSGAAKVPLPPVLETRNSENPTGPCLEKRLGVRYQCVAK